MTKINYEYKSDFLIPVPDLNQSTIFYNRTRINYGINNKSKASAEVIDFWLIKASPSKNREGFVPQGFLDAIQEQQNVYRKLVEKGDWSYSFSIEAMQDLIDKLGQPKFDAQPTSAILKIAKNAIPEYRKYVKSAVYFTGLYQLQQHELRELYLHAIAKYLVRGDI